MPVTRCVRCIIILVGLIAAASHASAAGYNLPQVSVTKSLSKTVIEKSEWSTVQIVATGDTQKQTQPFPTAVILAIDYSGSMQVNDAYKDASQAAKNVVGVLKPGMDKLGILTIKTTADWAVPLAPLTAAAIPAIHKKIDGFSPGGYTNYVEAFDKANTALSADPSPNKIVVFMTDGVPEPNTTKQQNYIWANRYKPAALGIRYFTIEFADAAQLPNLLLQAMANATGGEYQKATTQAALLPSFQKAVQTGQTTLSTQQVVVEEAVAPGLKIRPNSLSWSPPSHQRSHGLRCCHAGNKGDFSSDA